jgi:Flp pilus assembly protein TadG
MKNPQSRSDQQPDGLLRRMHRFRRDHKGIAAMEFALVAPIMIGMYFMLNETASGFRAARKVTMVARVMADITSRPSNITDVDRDDIFASAAQIIAPFSSSPTAYRISSIKFDATGNGFVDWSEVKSFNGGTLGPAHTRCTPTEARPSRPDLTPISVPAGLKLPSTSIILAEAILVYKPVIGWKITGTIDLKDQLYMRPRVSDSVTRNGVVSPDCTY